MNDLIMTEGSQVYVLSQMTAVDYWEVVGIHMTEEGANQRLQKISIECNYSPHESDKWLDISPMKLCR